MLIVTGSVQSRPETIVEVLALSVEHVRRSRAEPGCLMHSVHQDVEDPMRVVFVEQWEDKAALRAHLDAMRVAREAAGPPTDPGVPVLSSEIQQYEISTVGKVGS